LTKRQELDLFIERIDDYIESKYILADTKIVPVLKAIATSETLLALFKNCLADFDYEQAKKKYLVKSPYLSDDKGEFVLPQSSRDLLAFTFSFLLDVDSKRINLSDFISKYFYEDGSFAAGYSAFITSMIKPFRNAVKTLMEGVLDGKLEDPIKAVMQEERRKEREREEEQIRLQQEKELSLKAYGANVKEIREMLRLDKQNILSSKMNENAKNEMYLIIDMLVETLTSEDKDAISYAFTAYKFMVKAHPIFFFGKLKKIEDLVKGVLDAI